MSKVITGKVRLSYLTVWEPEAMDENSDPKYSVSLIIPKNDKKSLKKIEEAIEEVLGSGKSKLAEKNGKINKAKLKLPLRDGDVEKEGDEAYENAFFISAKSKTKPGVVDENLDPIIDREELYSGCYGRASVNFYAFNANGNKGVACGLNNLQKLEDGDRLDGSTSPEDDFSEPLDEEDDLF